jgi:hypothetical protein
MKNTDGRTYPCKYVHVQTVEVAAFSTPGNILFTDGRTYSCKYTDVQTEIAACSMLDSIFSVVQHLLFMLLELLNGLLVFTYPAVKSMHVDVEVSCSPITRSSAPHTLCAHILRANGLAVVQCLILTLYMTTWQLLNQLCHVVKAI